MDKSESLPTMTSLESDSFRDCYGSLLNAIYGYGATFGVEDFEIDGNVCWDESRKRIEIATKDFNECFRFIEGSYMFPSKVYTYLEIFNVRLDELSSGLWQPSKGECNMFCMKMSHYLYNEVVSYIK